MGVRIECAQCHHHPFDQWSQRDYYGMEAFFTQVNFKSTPSGQVLLPNRATTTRHPRTGDVVQAHALLQEEPGETPDGDRRRLFASWLTAADNKWFARNIVNRIWAQLTGRGIVSPVDDFRLTNPPNALCRVRFRSAPAHPNDHGVPHLPADHDTIGDE